MKETREGKSVEPDLQQSIGKHLGRTWEVSRLVAKPACWEICFRHISLNIQLLYHKWSPQIIQLIRHSMYIYIYTYIIFQTSRKTSIIGSPKANCMSAGFGFLDLCIVVFLEVQNKRTVEHCILQTILCMGFIYDIKSKYSMKCAGNLFPNILAQRPVSEKCLGGM